MDSCYRPSLAHGLLACMLFLTCVLLGVFLFIRVQGSLLRWLAFFAEQGILVDSGSAVHLCDDRSKLLNYTAFPRPVAVMGISGVSWCLGSGDMEITTVLRDDREETFTVHGVVYHPAAGMKILSTDKLRSQGIFYSTETQSLYRRHQCNGSQIDIGVVDGSDGQPKLKLAKEDVPARKPWNRLRYMWWQFQNRHKVKANLELDEDSHVYSHHIVLEKMAEQKQEIALLKRRLEDYNSMAKESLEHPKTPRIATSS